MQSNDRRSNGNRISVEQNENKYLERLAAQRRLYSIAKRIFNIQFAISVLMVFLGYLSAIFNNLIAGVNLLGVVAALMVSTVLPDAIKKYKKKAASIQEMLDCDLLRMQWNEALISKPDPEDVKKYSLKLLNKKKEKVNLVDWYEGIPNNLSYTVARIICQRYNLMWDLKLRESFSWTIKIVSFVSILILTFIWVYEDLSITSIIMSIVSPSLSLIIFTASQHNNNKDSIERMKTLKASVDALWKDLLSFNKTDEELKLKSRRLQDMIFVCRKDNSLVPDFYAMIKNKNLQATAFRTIEQLAEDYKDALKYNQTKS